MAKRSDSSYLEAVRILSKNLKGLELFASSSQGSQLESTFIKTISWCKGLSVVFLSNQAVIHLAGAWSEVVNILALVPLCFYRQSLMSMRIMLDEILAWSYYESHPVEFRTSTIRPTFWVSKERILEFHKIHSWGNGVLVEELGIWSEINRLYRELSLVIHAQNLEHMSLVESFENIAKNPKMIKKILRFGNHTDEAVAKFLGSIYQDAFTQFTPELQRSIIKGWNNKILKGLELSP